MDIKFSFEKELELQDQMGEQICKSIKVFLYNEFYLELFNQIRINLKNTIWLKLYDEIS